MKVRITEKGVIAKMEDGKPVRVPVGTELEIEGDAIPAHLKNKCMKLEVATPAKKPAAK